MNHIKSLAIQFPETLDPPDPDEPSFPPLFTSPNGLETLHLVHKTQLLSSLTVNAFPRLKHFTWTGVASRILHLPIPWTHLQTLVLEYDNFNHIVKLLTILKKVPNLISLKISMIERCDTHHCAAAREMDPLEFAQLTELDIKGTPEGLRAFLALIKAPRLTGFSFELYTPLGMDKLEEPKMCGILAMLFQSTKMRSLKLDNLPLPAPLLIRLLKYVSPTLEHLEIQDFPRFDGQVFNAFTVPPNGGDVLCPRLSSLVLKNATYLLMLMPGSYAKLVESRLATAYPLKSLYAIVTVDEFEEDAQRLRELNASGELEYLHWEEWEEDGYIDEW
ncbi:hypothetical protein ONZ45_g151 [Pleurotus djamor]|nr:hypothetical protein ONZ45_g151 [Pleurotus djamor]